MKKPPKTNPNKRWEYDAYFSIYKDYFLNKSGGFCPNAVVIVFLKLTLMSLFGFSVKGGGKNGKPFEYACCSNQPRQWTSYLCR